jgi:hypothetical protein
MLEAMSRHGHPWKQTAIVVGAHDFGQYYADIYRKCFLQAHKHSEHAEYLGMLWDAMAPLDEDFRVAVEAFRAGSEHRGTVYVSKDFVSDHAHQALTRMGIQEKAPLRSRVDPGGLREEARAHLPADVLVLADEFEGRVQKWAAGAPPADWRSRLRARVANRTPAGIRRAYRRAREALGRSGR